MPSVTEMFHYRTVRYLCLSWWGMTSYKKKISSDSSAGLLDRFSFLKILSILTTNRTEKIPKRYLNMNTHIKQWNGSGVENSKQQQGDGYLKLLLWFTDLSPFWQHILTRWEFKLMNLPKEDKYCITGSRTAQPVACSTALASLTWEKPTQTGEPRHRKLPIEHLSWPCCYLVPAQRC